MRYDFAAMFDPYSYESYGYDEYGYGYDDYSGYDYYGSDMGYGMPMQRPMAFGRGRAMAAASVSELMILFFLILFVDPS